jgi:hypothetical protein
MIYLRTTLNVLFFCTLFLLNSCTKSENLIPPDLIGNWKVVSFDDNVNLTKVFKSSINTWPDFNNGDNTVNFSKSSSTSGEINGINVTNSFTGNFEISSGNKIVIKDGIWTLINEPEWGTLFRSIALAESYELTGNNLIIFYNQKKNSISLIKISI